MAARLVRRVFGHKDAADVLPQNRPPRLFGAAMLIKIDDRDVGAFPGERYGDGAPNSTVAACDQRYLARQLADRTIAEWSGLGRRCHWYRRLRPVLLIVARRPALSEMPPICHRVGHAFSFSGRRRLMCSCAADSEAAEIAGSNRPTRERGHGSSARGREGAKVSTK
jgi:hypothetical protein